MNFDLKKQLPVFALGLVLGIAAGCVGQRAAMRHFFKRGHEPARILKTMSGELKLDETQKKAILPILEDTRAKMKSLRGEASGKGLALYASSRAEIRKLLRPEQQTKFDELLAEREERMKKRHEQIK